MGWFSSDAEVQVNISQLDDSIFDGIDNSRELRRAFNDFIDDVEAMWKHIWEMDSQGRLAEELGVAHPYSHGRYKAHIKKIKLAKFTRIKTALKAGIPIGAVYNDDEVAHFVEYGTGPDKPGGHGNWFDFEGNHHFSGDTPTPEFAPMRKTFAVMNSVGNVEHVSEVR